MQDALVIPPPIYRVIQEHVKSGKASQITLNINAGRVESAEVKERIKAES